MTAVTCDASGLIPLLRGLNTVEKSLRDESNVKLRNAAGVGANALILELRAAAGSSPTPQARLVAESMRVRRDRLIGVAIGGGKRVGSRSSPAGQLLWGSEHGGHNFTQPTGGAYWIEPAVRRFAAGSAQRSYIAAVNEILRDAGLT